jgi:uncharacterized RDD family membrane protein YckC
MKEQSAQPLRPANILWRISQGVIDDWLITAVALGLAWQGGVLPKLQFVEHNQSLSGYADVVEWLKRYLPLTAQIGATLVIYAVIKFIYYVSLVAWKGQTLACYLLGLKIVMADETPATFGSAIKRAFAGGVISHTPFIGQLLRLGDYVATFFNPRKQAVRDIVADTMLIHADVPKSKSQT